MLYYVTGCVNNYNAIQDGAKRKVFTRNYGAIVKLECFLKKSLAWLAQGIICLPSYINKPFLAVPEKRYLFCWKAGNMDKIDAAVNLLLPSQYIQAGYF